MSQSGSAIGADRASRYAESTRISRARIFRPRLGAVSPAVIKNGINAYFNMDNKDYRPDYEKRPCPHPDECSKTGFEVAEVSLPVEILPTTSVGEVETDCCGEPKVDCECDPCGNTCKLVITQRVKIKIPFKVGIKAITGNSYINCTRSDHCFGRDDAE